MKLKAKIDSACFVDGVLYVVFDIGHGQKTAPAGIMILSSDKKKQGCARNVLTTICCRSGIKNLVEAEQIVGAVVEVDVVRVACSIGISDVFVVTGVA